MKRGVIRAQEHLMTKKGNVAPCTKPPQNVREELWKLFKEKTATSSINPTANDDNESEDEIEISTGKGKNIGGKKGPMDMFFRNPSAAIEKRKREKLRQASIKEAWHQFISILLGFGTKQACHSTL